MRIQALVWIIPASAVAFNAVVATVVAGEPIRFVQPSASDKPLRFNFAREKTGSRKGLDASSASSPTSMVSSSEAPAASQPSPSPSPKGTVSPRTWSSLVTDPPGTKPESDRPQTTRRRRVEPESASLETNRHSGGLFSGNTGLAPRGPGSVSASGTDESAALGTSPSRPLADHQTAMRSLLPETSGKRSISSSAFGGVEGTFSGALKQSFGSPPGPAAPGTGSRIGNGGSNSNSIPPTGGLGSTTPDSTPTAADAGPDNPKLNPKPPPSVSPRPVFNPAERPLRSNFELPARPR